MQGAWGGLGEPEIIKDKVGRQGPVHQPQAGLALACSMKADHACRDTLDEVMKGLLFAVILPRHGPGLKKVTIMTETCLSDTVLKRIRLQMLLNLSADVSQERGRHSASL